MGDKGNIKIKYEDGNSIYFYGHWSGYKMFDILKDALIKGKSRWNDEAYLARIIFCELIKDSTDEITGFGIAPYVCDNEYPILSVNCSLKEIEMLTLSNKENIKTWNFNEFIELTKDPRNI